jgi:hypothetical protein
VQAIGIIRDETGAAIVTLHHPAKQGTGGRGNTVLRNELDAEIFFEGQGTNYGAPGDHIKLDWTKPPRDGVKPPAIHLVRGENGVLEVTDKKPHGSKAEKVRIEDQAILDVLKAGRMTLAELSQGLFDHDVVMSDTTLRKRVKEMGRRGRIELAGSSRGNTFVLWLPARVERSQKAEERTSREPHLDATGTEGWDP